MQAATQKSIWKHTAQHATTGIHQLASTHFSISNALPFSERVSSLRTGRLVPLVVNCDPTRLRHRGWPYGGPFAAQGSLLHTHIGSPARSPPALLRRRCALVVSPPLLHLLQNLKRRSEARTGVSFAPRRGSLLTDEAVPGIARDVADMGHIPEVLSSSAVAVYSPCCASVGSAHLTLCWCSLESRSSSTHSAVWPVHTRDRGRHRTDADDMWKMTVHGGRGCS